MGSDEVQNYKMNLRHHDLVIQLLEKRVDVQKEKGRKEAIQVHLIDEVREMAEDEYRSDVIYTIGRETEFGTGSVMWSITDHLNGDGTPVGPFFKEQLHKFLF